jgi:hypothetical protein
LHDEHDFILPTIGDNEMWTLGVESYFCKQWMAMIPAMEEILIWARRTKSITIAGKSILK